MGHDFTPRIAGVQPVTAPDPERFHEYIAMPPVDVASAASVASPPPGWPLHWTQRQRRTSTP